MELKKFLSSRYSTDDFEDFIRERFYGLEIQDRWGDNNMLKKLNHVWVNCFYAKIITT